MIKILIALYFLSTALLATPKIVVSIAPQKYFVQQIAGEDMVVDVLIPSDASPATYAPKPKTLQTLKNATLYFTIGVPFEKQWLSRFKSINPKLRLIDTGKNIQKIAIEEHEHEEDAHHHEGLDPHIWLSPSLVKSQAKVIYDTLSKQDPTHQATYSKNYQAFLARLDRLDKEITDYLSPLKNRKFIVFHPSFGYFAKAYDLQQIAIEKEGKEPSLRYLKRVIDLAKKEQIHTIFIAPQFSKKAAQSIAKYADAKVVTIDPLAQDWETNLLHIAKSLAHAAGR